MKIKITTDKGVWIDGAPRAKGFEVELDDVIADAIVANGFAEKIEAPKKETKRISRNAK